MDQNTATVLIALIGLVGSLSAAVLSAFVAIRVNGVKQDVRKIEVATNSMKDELVRMSRAEGKQEGKDESAAHEAKSKADIAAGREMERGAAPQPVTIVDEVVPVSVVDGALKGAGPLPVTIVDEAVPVAVVDGPVPKKAP